MTTSTQKPKWGDLKDEDGNNFDFLHPPPEEKCWICKNNHPTNKCPYTVPPPGVKCRICKKNHWTTKCPYKDLAPDPADATITTEESETKLENKKYVPPRPDAKGRDDENFIRVSNLSEDVRADDLQRLFIVFGPLQRVHVVFDRQTGKSRGFGFVNFVNREDGERAIRKLRYGYPNLILKVQWDAPRSEEEEYSQNQYLQ